MIGIVRPSKIDPGSLSGERYFQSLLEEGRRAGMLTEAEAKMIQAEWLRFLAYKSERYTCGDSSSIKVETAQNILRSILYTAGVFLKTLTPDDAVGELKKDTAASVYGRGRRRIGTKLSTARHLHALVLGNLLMTENITYNDTVKGGIKGFFRIYDADYAAHEIRITADYPLSNPPNGLVGIEFIVEYLKSVLLENEFCGRFDMQAVHDLMRSYHKDYEILIINIFDQVLASSIGCVLADIQPETLLIPKKRAFGLQSLWMLKTKSEIGEMVADAGAIMAKKMEIEDRQLLGYIGKSLPHISENIYLAVRNLTLDKVFTG